ncbi:MAG: hypothetical protein NC223_00115 [Butyrivibrio sp.]|nr:hypothetical protein [Butyrivibrio sp.]
MKKTYFIILMAALFLSGCAEGNRKTAKLAVSEVLLIANDENKIFDTDKYYEHEEYHIYEQENKEPKREITVGSESCSVQYGYSSSDPFENYDVDVYENAEDGVTVWLKQDTDKVVGYRNGISGCGLNDMDFSSEEELLKSVEEYVGERIDIDRFTPIVNTQVVFEGEGEVTGRNEEGFYIPQENEKAYYTISYTYLIGDIKTMEIFELNIVDNSVESYFYSMPEAFSKENNNFEISKDDVLKNVEEFIANNISGDCENVSYDTEDIFLSIDEKGNYILITVANMEYDYCGLPNESTEMFIVELQE